jgi:phosphoribosylaminoimidazole-succinocarboxamide synthase
VVLAAGRAQRFGATKQLARVAGRPLVAHAVDAARRAGVDRVFVVVGHDADAVATAAAEGGHVEVVTNPDHREGQSTSLRAGIAAAAATDAEVAVLLLADQPGVTAAAVARVAAAVGPGADATRARYDDGPSHPVAFARPVWPRLLHVRGDQGARALFGDLDVVEVAVPGPMPVDLDRPEDLTALRSGVPRPGTDDVQLEGLTHLRSGKVRDLYEVDDDHLLLVASDRVSTYDVVHPTPVPDKGRVLTGLSAFWFDRLGDRFPNHLVSTSVLDLPEAAQVEADWLRGRSMLVRKVDIVPFECVVRGYLVGSGWAEYRRDGTVCGLALPAGLVEADRLPEPIFTPATKAADGEHDQNVPFEVVVDALGGDLAEQLRERSLAVYTAGAEHAAAQGIILADTKFEFGLLDGRMVLADELLTPDSSRYWPADAWSPGATPPSFDKQFVRDYATSTGWDKTPPAPELPGDVVDATRAKYVEAYERLTGRPFGEWLSRT